MTKKRETGVETQSRSAGEQAKVKRDGARCRALLGCRCDVELCREEKRYRAAMMD
jgi:hypothetical protein